MASDEFDTVESVSNIWDMVIWKYAISGYSKHLSSIGEEPYEACEKKIVKYANDLELECVSVAQSICGIISTLESSGNKLAGVLSAITKEIKFGEISFSEAKENFNKSLDNHGWTVCVTIDSIEDFEINKNNKNIAIGGLIYSLGRFNARNKNVSAVFCLPGEYYFYLRKSSRAALKAFRYHYFLRWTAAELVELAGTRFAAFLDEENEKQESTTLLTDSYSLQVCNVQTAQKLLYTVIPAIVTEENGMRSESIACILRRTHLSPRQVIKSLNDIINVGLFSRDRYLKEINTKKLEPESSVHSQQISEKEFWYALKEATQWYCEDIFQSYESIHQNAEAVCSRLFPNLPKVITKKSLDAIINLQIVECDYFKDDTSVENVVRMLYEIGALGVVEHNLNQAGYNNIVVGRFVYTQLSITDIHDKNTMCVHPLFTEAFGYDRSDSRQVELLIHPFGTHIDGDDYRFTR